MAKQGWRHFGGGFWSTRPCEIFYACLYSNACAHVRPDRANLLINLLEPHIWSTNEFMDTERFLKNVCRDITDFAMHVF